MAVLIGLLFGSAALEIGLGYLQSRIQSSDRMDPGLIRYDTTLGWKLTPGWRGAHENYDFDVNYRVARSGFRGRSDYTQPGRRIGVFGDSFTFGLGVNDDETLVAALDVHLADTANAYNFGVPGYSTDQEVLLAERVLSRTRLSEVVLVVYLGNDLIDNMLGYPIQGPRAKPYFQLAAQNRLVRRNAPVPRVPKSGADLGVTYTSVLLGGNSAVQRPGRMDRIIGSFEIVRRLGISWPPPQRLFPAATRQFAESLRLFDGLVDLLRSVTDQRGSTLRLVLLPGRSYFANPRGYSAQYQDHIRQQILAGPAVASLPVVDLAARFIADLGRDEAAGQYFRYDGHLTAAGNRYAAGIIAEAFAP